MIAAELFTQLNIEHKTAGQHHHARHGWIQIDCPFCGKDTRRFHMGFSLSGQFVNCWKCGHHGLTETFMEITGLSYKRVKKLLRGLEKYDIKLPKTTGRYLPPVGRGGLLIQHVKYLESRGFDPKVIEKLWKVQGLGIAGRWSWRLFIPIFFRGKEVSWTTRTISNENPQRYLSASSKEEKISHKTLLYGEDYARQAIVICEGPLDVWALGPGAVATMGTGYSQGQLEKMSKYPLRAVCFDNEREAQKRAENLTHDLSVFPGETYNIRLDTGKDLAEANPREIFNIRYALGLYKLNIPPSCLSATL